MLRKSLGVSATKAKLKRMEAKQADRSRGAKVAQEHRFQLCGLTRISAATDRQTRREER